MEALDGGLSVGTIDRRNLKRDHSLSNRQSLLAPHRGLHCRECLSIGAGEFSSTGAGFYLFSGGFASCHSECDRLGGDLYWKIVPTVSPTLY